MYRVILIDDEPLIREGISRMLPWSSLGLELCRVLENGAQALDYLRCNSVDIVITDIRMPVMDGIDLIRAAAAEHISVRFILLSGYEEFEYARTAMKYGITHYLLKPTDENRIMEALTDICGELESQNSQQTRILRLEQQAAAGFLSEYLSGDDGSYQKYSASDIPYFANLLAPEGAPCTLLLFLLPGCQDSLLMFSLKNIVLEVFSGQPVLCHLIRDNRKLLLLLKSSPDPFPPLADKAAQAFREIFAQTAYFSLSPAGSFHELPSIYEKMLSNIRSQSDMDKSTECSITDRIKQAVAEHLANPALSLKWIARNRLFMNENYLGKVFYKKTGMKFNRYLKEAKIERIKAMLAEDSQIKLIALCEAVGLENNPAYLSTLFKNHTGMTLTEYRKRYTRL